MNVMVTGASGFVGTALCRALLEKGFSVTGTGRSVRHPLQHSDRFRWVSADTTVEGQWQEWVKKSDIIINLAGKSIFGYWSENYKSEIYDSRVLTTRNIVSAIPDKGSGASQRILFSASAIGYYGDRGEDILAEGEPAGNDFLARICIDWENEAMKAQSKGVRVAAMRFGVVLGKGGGAIEKMVPAFRMFSGGPLGRGSQWFPWIHIGDLLSAIFMLMENNSITGPVNFIAPGAVRHREFAAALGRVLRRPSLMPAPGFLIKMVAGELGNTFLSSQRATPSVLEKNGFSFSYGDIDSALEEILLPKR